jgi:hypothetical protein
VDRQAANDAEAALQNEIPTICKENLRAEDGREYFPPYRRTGRIA